MQYYRCRDRRGAMLWQEITDDGASVTRLLDALGNPLAAAEIPSYGIESMDQALWPAELLPAYLARKQEQLAANYNLAAQRDYSSSALGAPHIYPADLVSKLYMTARNAEALIRVGAPAWHASSPVTGEDFVRPTVDNGWAYRCTVAGTTGAGEPAWPATAGATVADGSATWQAWSRWTGDFTCTDAHGVTARRPHTAKQMMQVGLDGIAAMQALLDARDGRAAALAACASLAAADALDLTL